MYIVIEAHGGLQYAGIVLDEEGNNKVFNTIEEASQEKELCQDGIIVGDRSSDEVSNEEIMLYLLRELYKAYEEGKSIVHIKDLLSQFIDVKQGG